MAKEEVPGFGELGGCWTSVIWLSCWSKCARFILAIVRTGCELAVVVVLVVVLVVLVVVEIEVEGREWC